MIIIVLFLSEICGSGCVHYNIVQRPCMHIYYIIYNTCKVLCTQSENYNIIAIVVLRTMTIGIFATLDVPASNKGFVTTFQYYFLCSLSMNASIVYWHNTRNINSVVGLYNHSINAIL